MGGVLSGHSTDAGAEPPLALGDTPQRLRIIDARFENGIYTARLQVFRGRLYRVRVDVPFVVMSIDGGRETAKDGRIRTIEIAVPEGPPGWVDTTLQIHVAQTKR